MLIDRWSCTVFLNARLDFHRLFFAWIAKNPSHWALIKQPNPAVKDKRMLLIFLLQLRRFLRRRSEAAMAALALPSFQFPFCPKLPSTSQKNFGFVVSFFSSYLASPPLRSSPVDRPSAISLRRRRSLPRASSEGIPVELAEDSKFVPLNADDPIYGPPVLLLVGFEADEKEKIQMFLKELDGNFLKVIYCTEDMIEKTVWDAMHTEQVHLDGVKIAKSLPRLCILSGLSGEEMVMFIDAFPETGLQPAVFAALVPNSADKLLREVIDEIIGDHEMLAGKQSH